MSKKNPIIYIVFRKDLKYFYKMFSTDLNWNGDTVNSGPADFVTKIGVQGSRGSSTVGKKNELPVWNFLRPRVFLFLVFGKKLKRAILTVRRMHTVCCLVAGQPQTWSWQVCLKKFLRPRENFFPHFTQQSKRRVESDLGHSLTWCGQTKGRSSKMLTFNMYGAVTLSTRSFKNSHLSGLVEDVEILKFIRKQRSTCMTE